MNWLRGAALVLILAFSMVSLGVSNAFASASEKEAPENEEPYYLELKPVSIPIRKSNGTIRYYMFITLNLEFDEQDKKDHARRMIPRIRDAFLQDLSGRTVLHKDKRRGMDFEAVKKRLMKQSSKVLSKNAPVAVHIVKVFKGM
ncbi:MAG: hypothetical protein JKY12_05570 [Sneathiella sp.]|nr:hypothetical protein [Sneathiella sp.]